MISALLVFSNVMEQLLAGESLNHKQAIRFQLLLGKLDGKGTNEIAEVLRLPPVSISVIVHGFNKHGVQALLT